MATEYPDGIDDFTPITPGVPGGSRMSDIIGGATGTLDVYDIAANTWTSNVVYQRQTETFTTGSAHELVGDYIYSVKDATGRMFRFDVAKQKLDPFATLTYPQGAATVGDKLFDASYTDGGTTIRWIYLIRNTGTEMFRCMVI